jgi:hypothetical protein
MAKVKIDSEITKIALDKKQHGIQCRAMSSLKKFGNQLYHQLWILKCRIHSAIGPSLPINNVKLHVQCACTEVKYESL